MWTFLSYYDVYISLQRLPIYLFFSCSLTSSRHWCAFVAPGVSLTTVIGFRGVLIQTRRVRSEFKPDRAATVGLLHLVDRRQRHWHLEEATPIRQVPAHDHHLPSTILRSEDRSCFDFMKLCEQSQASATSV